MKYIFFIFKYKFRRQSLNNFLKCKKIENFKIINLSGPILCYIGKIILMTNLSKKFFFLSCDGLPFLSNEKNSINIWFGGTDFKINKDFQQYKNNFVTASNLFSRKNNLINFYPCDLAKSINFSSPKIVIAMKVSEIKDKNSLKIWNKNKLEIFENLSLLDNEVFWENQNIDNLSNIEKHKIYINLRILLRLELIKKIKNVFGKKCILIGDDLKKIYPESYPSNYDANSIANFYQGNICVDFMAKDGEETLYTRSIQIIESGGILFQAFNKNSKNLFNDLTDRLTFNSSEDMISKLNFLLFKENLNELFNFFVKKYNKKNLNYQTIQKIFNL